MNKAEKLAVKVSRLWAPPTAKVATQPRPTSETREEAITATCQLAGKPELAADFIASGLTAAEVTRQLTPGSRENWRAVLRKLEGR